MENWSAARRDVLHVEAEAVGQPMEPETLDWRFKDTLSLRLGGELLFELSHDTHLAARAGFFYETATTEVSDTNLAIISPPRMAPTVGLGLRWGRLALNVAYLDLARRVEPEHVHRALVRMTQDSLEPAGGIP